MVGGLAGQGSAMKRAPCALSRLWYESILLMELRGLNVILLCMFSLGAQDTDTRTPRETLSR